MISNLKIEKGEHIITAMIEIPIEVFLNNTIDRVLENYIKEIVEKSVTKEQVEAYIKDEEVKKLIADKIENFLIEKYFPTLNA